MANKNSKNKPRSENTTKEEIDAFLAKGGVIKKIPYGEKGDITTNIWGRRVKKKEPEKDASATNKPAKS